MGSGVAGEDSELGFSFPLLWQQEIEHHIIDVRLERKNPIPKYVAEAIQREITERRLYIENYLFCQEYRYKRCKQKLSHKVDRDS